MKTIWRTTQITLLLLASALFSGCVLFHGYRAPVQQGNVIKTAQLNQLHNGMSKNQVIAIMGTPILTNTFSDNRFNYVYTYQIERQRLHEKRVIVSFDHGRVNHVEKDLAFHVPHPGLHPHP